MYHRPTCAPRHAGFTCPCQYVLFSQTRLGKWDGAVVSGFTFALLHLDPASFLRFTLLGTAGALAAWETGSVLPALAVHAGHNLAAIASLAAVQ